MAEDYYSLLGVSRGATQAEIQKAYRQKARENHPDMNPKDKGAKERFQKIQQAFDVLGVGEKRKLYDQFGPDFERFAGAQANGGGGGGPQWRSYTRRPGGGAEQFEDIDLSSIFGAGFGGGGGGGAAGFEDILRQFGAGGAGAGTRRGRRPPPPPTQGESVQAEVTVPFTIAIKGGETQLSVQRGQAGKDTITVKIPPGVKDGGKIRLRGQGMPSPTGGAPGDILLKINVAPHPFFTRKDRNLHLSLPISLAEATAGGKVDVPTPGGTVTLTIPPGTSSGKKMRIPGHGIVASGDKPAGDMVVEIRVVLPDSLSDEDREALAAIAKKYPGNPRSDLRL